MSFISSIFQGVGDLLGISPKKPAAPNMPTQDQIAAQQDAAAQDETRRLARGRTSTLLTGSRGLTDTGTTSKVLLGQ